MIAAARPLRALGADDVDLRVHHAPAERDVVLFLLEPPDLGPELVVVQPARSSGSSSDSSGRSPVPSKIGRSRVAGDGA